eukprot:s3282_g9.t1
MNSEPKLHRGGGPEGIAGSRLIANNRFLSRTSYYPLLQNTLMPRAQASPLETSGLVSFCSGQHLDNFGIDLFEELWMIIMALYRRLGMFPNLSQNRVVVRDWFWLETHVELGIVLNKLFASRLL